MLHGLSTELVGPWTDLAEAAYDGRPLVLRSWLGEVWLATARRQVRTSSANKPHLPNITGIRRCSRRGSTRRAPHPRCASAGYAPCCARGRMTSPRAARSSCGGLARRSSRRRHAIRPPSWSPSPRSLLESRQSTSASCARSWGRSTSGNGWGGPWRPTSSRGESCKIKRYSCIRRWGEAAAVSALACGTAAPSPPQTGCRMCGPTLRARDL